MTNLNRITLLGNVGSEPKTAATQSGRQVTRFSLATNKRYKDGEDWKTKATWHNVAVWGDSADYAAKIQPGSLVFLEGELTNHTYEREIGGVKVDWPVTEVVVSSISVVKAKAEKGEAA